MPNLTLLTNPDEMRDVAGSLDNLISEFDRLRMDMKAAVEQELREACSGAVAEKFTASYNENVDTGLVEERVRLEGVSQTLKASADNFEGTAEGVMSQF